MSKDQQFNEWADEVRMATWRHNIDQTELFKLYIDGQSPEEAIKKIVGYTSSDAQIIFCIGFLLAGLAFGVMGYLIGHG